MSMSAHTQAVEHAAREMQKFSPARGIDRQREVAEQIIAAYFQGLRDHGAESIDTGLRDER